MQVFLKYRFPFRPATPDDTILEKINGTYSDPSFFSNLPFSRVSIADHVDVDKMRDPQHMRGVQQNYGAYSLGLRG